MKNIKMSVIVPVYNCERYLKQCLDSLVAASDFFGDGFEAIIINDGSTDNSLSIIKDYGFPGFMILNQPDIGQAYTVNKGIKMASGEYIAELDADDYVYPDMYRKLYDIAIANNSDAVKCHFDELDDQTGSINVRKQIDSFFCDYPMNFKELQSSRQNILIGRIPSFFSGIYRRDFLLDNNLLYREHIHFEDCSLSKKIAMTAKNFIFHDESLYTYRTNREGSGTSTIKNRYDICKQYDELVRYSDKYGLNATACINSIRFYDYMWMASRITDETERTEFFHRASNDFYKNPTEAQYFNTIEDWNTYKIIRMYHDEAK